MLTSDPYSVYCEPEVSTDRIRIGYPAGYLRYFRMRIGFGYSFLKKIGSGRIRILV